jgi:signal transduction histidine kinase
MWLLPSPNWNERAPEQNPIGLIFGLPQTDARVRQPSNLSLKDSLLPGTPSIIIRRVYGIWGSRFAFSESFDFENDQTRLPFAATTGANRSHATVSVPIGEASNPLGYVELSAGADYSNQTLSTARRALFLAGIVSLLLACALGLWMGHRLTTPIVHLTQTTTRMSNGDLSVRATVSGKDEISELARQFNTMAEQLQNTFNQLAAERDALRRFIADASHELRTPITALRNYLDLLQSSAAEDQQIRDEFLAESQTQLDRLIWMTNNLLDLSRLDAGLISLELASHDLHEMVNEVAHSFKSAIEEKQITLLVNIPKSLTLYCDRHRMLMCLSNLFDNALRYTPQGGFIEIGAQQEATQTTLWVRDNGPGIPTSDLPHIFDRFYQGKNAPAYGSGLGLSIVQSIVKAHGGKVYAENHPEGGAKFTITLPFPSL